MRAPAIVTDVVRRGDRTVVYSCFGLRVPYLTDFLKIYDESAGPERRKAILNDVLAEQIRFVHTFQGTGWQDCALDLRFFNVPARGRVEIVLLGRACGGTEAESLTRIRALYRHVTSTFPMRLFSLVPITAGAAGEEALKYYRGIDWAGSGTRRLFEYRSHETMERLPLGDAYVVYPMRSEEDALQRGFQLLAAGETPTVVSVCIQPATLSADERERLAFAASTCRENERRQEQLIGRTGTIVNVQAGHVADVFEHHLAQLQDPLWLRIAVAFRGEPSSGLLASLASDVSRDIAGPGEQRMSNKRGEFVEAVEGCERVAWFNVTHAEALDWLPRDVDPPSGLERLRHLVSAEGANGAFRLPLPSIGGLGGIDLVPVSLFEELPDALRLPPAGSAAVPIGDAYIPLLVLTRHLLVAGTIGSGKTQTVFQLLHALWTLYRVPFLVIEPVNAEHDDYRALGRYLAVPDELRVFTLGDETTSPFRLNPFHLTHGVILHTHLSGLLACFVAALPFGDDSPLPALFREAIRNVYFARGWSMDDRGGERPALETPTLEDLRDELAWLIEQRYGRGTETAQTMIGASVTRVNALLNSGAGGILMARHSIPLPELFEKPTILELRHLGSEEDKRLMTGFLLLFLQEYCDRNRPTHPRRLNHIVVLEEAHNLMQEVEDADSQKAAAVKLFTNMLAENRKYGQAFFVVEQIPTLLAEGALKNTVTKVMHRLPGKDDVEHMGATMNFKERHQHRAVCLRTGEAFLHTDGLNEATLVQVQENVSKDRPLTDAEIRQQMEAFRRQHATLYAEQRPFAGCAQCDRPCTYRREVARYAYDRQLGAQVMRAYEAADPTLWVEAVRGLTAPLLRVVSAHDTLDAAGAIYCLFLHLRQQHKRLDHVVNLERVHQTLQQLYTKEQHHER